LRRSAIYCDFPTADEVQHDPLVLDVAIRTVASFVKREIRTLVYCREGMSRSPAVVAAALSIVQGGSPEENLRKIAAGQPHDVSPHLWDAVLKSSSRKR
jgi:protein-tyrosine phosphatase